jgi:adenine-specific DNA-methyltransferase
MNKLGKERSMTKERRAEPVHLESANPLDDRLDQLRDLFPDAFTEGRLDLDKFRAAAGDVIDDRPERYTFTWAGKRDVIDLPTMDTGSTRP